MPQIVVENLRKTFQIAQRRKGLWGAATGLFYRTHQEVHALDDVSFNIEASELVPLR